MYAYFYKYADCEGETKSKLITLSVNAWTSLNCSEVCLYCRLLLLYWEMSAISIYSEFTDAQAKEKLLNVDVFDARMRH